MNVTLRTHLQDGDLGQMVYLHGVLYGYGLSFECYVAETLADFFRHFDGARERIWVAEAEGKVVGSLALKDSDGWAQLRYFLIHPDYRGQGLGRQLMDLFMQEMRAMGYPKSFLLTIDGLEASAHLYRSYGYRQVDSQAMDFGLTGHRYELHEE